VPATEIARKLTGGPFPHAALAGGFAALTGVVTLDAVRTAVRRRFPGPTGRAHAAAATATFGVVRTAIEDLVQARPQTASS
jgi:pyruvate ferredoxin oxidoreductase gamma subunit